MSLQQKTYCLPFTKGDADHIPILLGPLGDLLNMAIFHLNARDQINQDQMFKNNLLA